MSDNVQKWAFRLTTIFTPLLVGTLTALGMELDEGGVIDWRPISSAAISSFIIAWANFIRAINETTPAGEMPPV
jgi:hypothetical protein